MCRSRSCALALAAGIAFCAASVVAAQPPAGDRLIAQGSLTYTFYCAACHGGNGGGNAASHAPQLAGRDATSLVRQISALRDAARADRGDGAGQHARSLAPLSAVQIEGIAEYLASLAPPPTIAN